MPRNISVAMKAHISQSVVTLTTLIRLDRPDGVSLGFTAWDVPITYGGLTYQPAISMSPSGVKSNSDLTADQMDIIGAIDSVFIKEEDIEGGRYDMCIVTVVRVNPNDLTMGPIIDLFGYVDSIEFGDGTFTVSVVSVGQRLNQTFGDIVTPVCRVNQLGDFQCKVDMSMFTFNGVVAGFSGGNILTFSNSHITGYFDYGKITFKTIALGGGANNNLSMEIKASTQLGANVMQLIFQQSMPFPIAVADTFIVEAGCDRRPTTCRNKFNNLINIHCEPYVPGNLYLISTGRPPG